MKTIYVLITMDVEKPLPDGERPDGASGPRTYAQSERYIRGYDAMARAFGWPVTYIIHPEVCHAHRDLFLQLEGEGACLGLHIHPWKFSDGHYKAHFGGLTEAQQYAILSEATDMWMAGLGKRPRYFRPGTFSANDRTFGVLDTLGFLGGSCSIPGRVYPDLNAVWAGATPDPHRANATFRQLPGDLDFVDIPLSVDLSSHEVRGGRQFCWDLRPDWEKADYRAVATNIVAQVIERNPAVPVIHMVTHNDNDYADPADRVRRNFQTVLEQIDAAIRRAGATPQGATFADVTTLVRERGQTEKPFTFADKTMLTG